MKRKSCNLFIVLRYCFSENSLITSNKSNNYKIKKINNNS